MTCCPGGSKDCGGEFNFLILQGNLNARFYINNMTEITVLKNLRFNIHYFPKSGVHYLHYPTTS